MKTVLLTGSAGFAGAHIVDYILEKTDWKIIGLDSFKHRGDALRVYQDPERYSVYYHDLRAPITDRMINIIGPIDYIFNVASDSHVDRSIQDPIPFVENNVSLTLNVLEYSRKIKPSVFMQMSTDEVYGPAEEGYSSKEWDSIKPSNPYSASKACQEAICFSYWRTYGVPLIITNTMNLFGERQEKEKYIPSTISKILRGDVVTVHGSGKYIGKRMYLHARNQADGMLFLINNIPPVNYFDNVSEPHRFNIVGNAEMDNLSLAKLIANIIGKELRYKLTDYHLTRPGHDRRYALDGSKMESLGWKQPIGFEESLKRTIEWTLENPEWA